MSNTKIKPMNLYPTLDSTKQVVELAQSKLPEDSKNEVISLLYTYHNTLLKEVNNESSNQSN